jgi:hypothetical protein
MNECKITNTIMSTYFGCREALGFGVQMSTRTLEYVKIFLRLSADYHQAQRLLWVIEVLGTVSCSFEGGYYF